LRSGDDRVGPEDVPTRAEVQAIRTSAPPRGRAGIALGVSGLRISEVIGLTKDRIDLDTNLVAIDRQLQRLEGEMTFTPPKGGKTRVIRVPSAVALELRRHLRSVNDDELLFRGARGAMPRRDDFYRTIWRPALTGAGLADSGFVFHGLRHFCASSMLAAGVNPMAVAGYIGDTLETLQRTYAHWLRDDRDVPTEALDRILVIDAPEDSADFSRTSGLSEV
jgi:integrase